MDAFSEAEMFPGGLESAPGQQWKCSRRLRALGYYSERAIIASTITDAAATTTISSTT